MRYMLSAKLRPCTPSAKSYCFHNSCLLGCDFGSCLYSRLEMPICPLASKYSPRLVTSSYVNSYNYSDHVHEGHYAFQATETGDYMACFFAAYNKPSTTITIDFDWKSNIAAKDWTNVAKKGSVEDLLEKKLFCILGVEGFSYLPSHCLTLCCVFS